MADEAFSIIMMTLCKMSKEKELWLDMNEFEERFDQEPSHKPLRIKYNKVEGALPIFKEVNPDAEPVRKNGALVPNPALRDKEIIPFRYPGGIDGFLQNEILPYASDSWIDKKSVVTGYELSFTKYFYKPKELRTIAEISKDIRDIEQRTDGMLNEILG